MNLPPFQRIREYELYYYVIFLDVSYDVFVIIELP